MVMQKFRAKASIPSADGKRVEKYVFGVLSNSENEAREHAQHRIGEIHPASQLLTLTPAKLQPLRGGLGDEIVCHK